MDIFAGDFGAEEDLMQAYFREGVTRATALGNRGPLRLSADGKLAPPIVETYRRTGFYILEGVLDAAELAEIKSAVHDMLDRLPSDRDSPVDRYGRPALGSGGAKPVIIWSKPLGDPYGGTGLVNGRAPVKMVEAQPAARLSKEVPLIIAGVLQFCEPALRLYGHPDLLAVAAAINGDDFVPYAEVVIVKQPGRGGSFAWHQDGTTHWESERWDPDIHGVNLMVQLDRCTPANAVWYVPGSHALGQVDIRKLVDEVGSNRLPQAVPLICNPGDVAISNRQIVHGSFPNTTSDWRVTLTFGFHRRSAVVGVRARGPFGDTVTYDAERVRQRCEMVGYAIDARRRRFPDQKPFSYRPHVDSGEQFSWNEAAPERIRHYNALDLFL